MKTKNVARDVERKMKAIRKNVKASWEKCHNPNMFGGYPVVDPNGKIISIEVAAYGFVAEFFEEEDIQKRLIEAFRKNTLNFGGYEKEDLEKSIKENVESLAPEPPLPIFLMKSYPLQSYLSQLTRSSDYKYLKLEI